jgi:hypothetical protein
MQLGAAVQARSHAIDLGVAASFGCGDTSGDHRTIGSPSSMRNVADRTVRVDRLGRENE